MEFLKAVGTRVKKIRTDKNISQEAFAGQLGYDRAYLSRVESGKQNITIETFKRICDGLGVTVKEFFDFKED